MNPIEMVRNIADMNPAEALDYSRYRLTASEVKAISDFYRNKLPWLAELDGRLYELIEQAKQNIEFMEARTR